MTLPECILCLGCEPDFPLQKSDLLEMSSNYSQQEYVNICKTYLTVKVKSSNICDTIDTKDVISNRICMMCLPSVKKLLRIHKKLEETQKTLNEYAGKLSEILLNRRRRKEIFATTDADLESVKLELEEYAQLLEEDDFLLDNVSNILPEELPDDFDYENLNYLSPIKQIDDFSVDDDSPKNIPKTETDLKDNVNLEMLEEEPKHETNIEANSDRAIQATRRSLRVEIKRNIKSERLKTGSLQSDNGYNRSGSDDFKTSNSGTVSLECKKCVKSFASKSSYSNHCRLHTRKNKKELLSHHGKKSRFVEPKKKKPKTNLHTTDNKIFKCETCEKTFKRRIYLEAHQNVHTAKRNYACEICGKPFRWSRNLVDHKKSVHFVVETKSESSDKSPSHTCYKCEITMKDVDDVKEHLKTVHMDEKLEKPYPCEKCEKSFTTVTYLRNHQKVHSDERNHVCDFCSKAFRWAKNLAEHKTNVHEKETFPCNLCGEKLNLANQKLIETHMNEHHPGVEFQKSYYGCETCGKTFETEYVLRLHKKIHIEERNYVCEICSKTFRWKKNLTEHKKAVHALHLGTTIIFSCDVCKITLDNFKAMEDHMSEEHPGEKPFKCVECGESFALKSYLETHKHLHKFEQGHICNLCGKAFNWRKNLVAHRKTVHAATRMKQEEILEDSNNILGNSPKPQSCSECGKTLASRSALQDHLRLHTGETPFQCDHEDCQMKFRTLENLKRHKINVHTTEYPFMCDQCTGRFKFKNQLSRHIQSYHPSVDKLHVCELCGKAFKRAYGLRDHMRSHNVEEKLNCALCDKKFTLKSSLVAHVKLVHTQEVSFICDICDKRLSSKIKLDDHIRTHTKEKPFECEICLQSFTSKTNLCKHRKTTGHYSLITVIN